MPIMAMAHLQRAGHKPIAIIGGGTTMVGDPSGKTEMRKLLGPDEIAANGRGILGQLQRYLHLDGTAGRFINNADWLLPLRYIDFLREIGRYFKVNEMIKAEAYRMRLEREEGLSFIEFNYQLLQAYDFLKLFQDHGCVLQIGGDDQWSNILAGVDLVRRIEGKATYGLTFPLLSTARGEKMGKTAQGALWLSAPKTSPYDFYQYWINVDDRDVEHFLAYFTFLPMDQVRELGRREGAGLQESKTVLAIEATKLCHGEQAAEDARKAALAAFAGGDTEMSAMPTTSISRDALAQGIPFVDLLVRTGLAKTKNEARRLILQGGAYVNRDPVLSVDAVIRPDALINDAILLQHGKKKFHRVIIAGD
jgi:tyrosyl-tRNA synthetase